MSSTTEARMSAFKGRGAQRPEEQRRRREEQTVELRKTKKDEALAKRRNIPIAPAADFDDDAGDMDGYAMGGMYGGPAADLLQDIPIMVQQLMSSNPADQLDATSKFRRLLSKGMLSWCLGCGVSCLLTLVVLVIDRKCKCTYSTQTRNNKPP
jgi:importin subunit alpha-6/7